MKCSLLGRKNLWFLLKQLGRMAILLFLVSAAAFFLVTVSPIDPLKVNVGQAALGSMSQEQIAKLSEYWGTDLPPIERFLSWAGDFFKRGYGNLSVIPPARIPCDWCEAVKLSLADGSFLAGFRGSWFCPGNTGRRKQGENSG